MRRMSPSPAPYVRADDPRTTRRPDPVRAPVRCMTDEERHDQARRAFADDRREIAAHYGPR